MSPAAEIIRDQLVALLPRLRRFARALSPNAHAADVLVELSVERGQLHLDQLRPEARLDTWMFGIVTDAWLHESRSRKRRDELLAPAKPGAQLAGSSSEAPMSRLSIEAALERLPDEQRVAVALVLVEGLEYKEAAAVLDLPLGTVTNRLARGCEALEALVRRREGGV